MFPLKKRTYFGLYLLSVFAAPIFAIASFAIYRDSDVWSQDGLKVAFVTLLCLVPLTYPLGILPTLLSLFLSVYLGWMTPFGSVIFLIPLYAAMGYLPWLSSCRSTFVDAQRKKRPFMPRWSRVGNLLPTCDCREFATRGQASYPPYGFEVKLVGWVDKPSMSGCGASVLGFQPSLRTEGKDGGFMPEG